MSEGCVREARMFVFDEREVCEKVYGGCERNV